jgi:hypothetical protein
MKIIFVLTMMIGLLTAVTNAEVVGHMDRKELIRRGDIYLNVSENISNIDLKAKYAQIAHAYYTRAVFSEKFPVWKPTLPGILSSEGEVR